MGKLLALALKDLRVMMADKGNIFWVFGFPSAMALLFGAVYADVGKGPTGMALAVVNEDGSEFAESYIAHLEANEALVVTRMDRDPALERVRRGKLAAAVVLRPGFGDGFGALFDANDPKLQIAGDPGRRMQAAYLEGLLAKAQFEVLTGRFTDRPWMRGQLATWRSEIAEANDLSSGEAGALLRYLDAADTLLADVNDQTLQTPLAGGMMNVAKLDVQRKREGPQTAFQITFPQAIIWGVLACAATFAVSIVKERTTGTYQRLCIGPISQAHILAGKGLACFTTCLLVICLLLTGGKLIFKPPIGSPILFVLGALCTVLCFVGIMMLISTLGKTEQSVGGASWAVMMVMAMFGGAMMPLAFMPSWMRTIGSVSPIKWGILAMEGAIWRGFSLREMLGPCAILITLGAACFALGTLILKRRQI